MISDFLLKCADPNGNQRLTFASMVSGLSNQSMQMSAMSDINKNYIRIGKLVVSSDADESFSVSFDEVLSGFSGVLPERSIRASQDNEVSTEGEIESNIVIPVVPQDMYMHTIAARPSFHEKRLPARSYTFLIVNTIMISGLIAGAVLDVTTDHTGPTL